MSLSALLGSMRRGKKPELPTQDDWRMQSSELANMSKGLNALVESIAAVADNISKAAKSTSQMALLQAKANAAFNQGTVSSDSYSESLGRVNKELKRTGTESQEASKRVKELSENADSLMNKLASMGIDFAKFISGAALYETHVLEGAKRNMENRSKGGANLTKYNPTAFEAHRQAREMKAVLDEVAEAGAQVGITQEESFAIAAQAMDNLNFNLDNMTSKERKEELAGLVKNVSGVGFAIGKDANETFSVMNSLTTKMSVENEKVLNDLAGARVIFDDLRAANEGMTYSTEAFTDVILEAVRGSENYNTNLSFMSKLVSRVTQDTFRMTGSMDKSLAVSKRLLGLFDKPPEWIDSTLSADFINEARLDLEKFAQKMGLNEAKKAEIKEILAAEGSGYAKSKLITESLKGSAGYSKAIVEKLKAAGATSIDSLQALAGLEDNPAAALALQRAMKNGGLDKDLDASLNPELVKEQDKRNESSKEQFVEAANQLREAADNLQGFGEELRNAFRNDIFPLLIGAGLAWKVGGGILRGGARALGLGLGGISAGAGAGGAAGAAGGGAVPGLLSRLFGRGGATGGKGGILGGIASMLTGGGGSECGCVRLCEGSPTPLPGGLGGAAGAGSGAAGAAGAGATAATGGGMLKNLLSKVPGVAAIVEGIIQIPKTYAAITDPNKGFGDKLSAVTDAASEVGLAFGTAGVSTLIKSIVGTQVWEKYKNKYIDNAADALSWVLDDAEDYAKHKFGRRSREDAMMASKNGTNWGGNDAVVDEVAGKLWDKDGNLRKEYKHLLPMLGSGQLTTQKAVDIKKHIDSMESKIRVPNYSSYDRSMNPSADSSNDSAPRKVNEGMVLEGGKLQANGDLVGKFTMKAFGHNVKAVTTRLETHRINAGGS